MRRRQSDGGQHAAHVVAGLGTRLDQAAIFQQLPSIKHGINADLMRLRPAANRGKVLAALMDHLGEVVS